MGATLWIRYGVAGLSKISPKRAASLALRFFREPRLTEGYSTDDLKRLEKAEAVLALGRRRERAILGKRIVSYSFAARGPARGVVLLLHGWSGDSRAMAAFPGPLAEAGYDVIGIDLPAHGGSEGTETDVVEAASVVRGVLHAEGVAPDHIIAHSFGGAVATLLAEDGVYPASLVSVSAPTDFAMILTEVAAAFALGPKAQIQFGVDIASSLQRDPEQLDAVAIWRDLPTRILILHAPDDQRVSFEHARHFNQLPNARLIPVRGLDHCEVIYAPATVAASLDHIKAVDALRGAALAFEAA